MSIPARVDRDPDLLIAMSLDDIPVLLATLAERDAALAAVTRERDGLKEAGDRLCEVTTSIRNWGPYYGATAGCIANWRALTRGANDA